MRTLTSFYDLAHGPVSFDFCTWLVRAISEQRARECERLHVVIVPLEEGLGGFARHWGNHDEHATLWRLWNICVAACPLARATVTVAESRAQARSMKADAAAHWWPDGKQHFMGPLVDAARKGGAIPRLQATEAARRYVAQWLNGRKVVTLTTREQSTDPDRNSNRAAWAEFSKWLTDNGRAVIALEDSNKALASGAAYAEASPDLRLALYEAAEMNVIGNNGPQELLKFSDAPYRVMLGSLTAGWRDHFRKYFHMEPGDQLPWAGPNQRLVYRPDTLDVLREEFAR